MYTEVYRVAIVKANALDLLDRHFTIHGFPVYYIAYCMYKALSYKQDGVNMTHSP